MTQVRRTQLCRSTRTGHLGGELGLDAAARIHARSCGHACGGAANQRSRPTATHSISTRAFLGRPAAAIVVRAGGDTGNAAP